METHFQLNVSRYGNVIGYAILVGATIGFFNTIMFYFFQIQDWIMFLTISVVLLLIGLGLIIWYQHFNRKVQPK